ncbi:MAG TPA: hypothetical protein VKB38_08060 [Terracidiphilus sp.]|nr:hypothetical protein [Terracidiphilus sp.]
MITGTMGAGKSAVLAEASDLLSIRGIVHAAIDLDAIGLAHLSPAAIKDEMMYANFESVCGNYARMGVRRFLVARAMESQAELELCRNVSGSANVAVCRLTASPKCLRQRVRSREIGILQDKFVARVDELNAILDQANLEDFAIENEGRPITAVAREMLIRTAWIDD